MTLVKENLKQIWIHWMEPPTEVLLYPSQPLWWAAQGWLPGAHPAVLSFPLLNSREENKMRRLMVKIKTWRMFIDCHHGQNRLREIIYYKLNYAWTVFLPDSGPFCPGSTSSLHPLHREVQGMRNGRLWLGKWHSLSGAAAQATAPIRRTCSCLGFPWAAFPPGHLPCSGLGLQGVNLFCSGPSSWAAHKPLLHQGFFQTFPRLQEVLWHLVNLLPLTSVSTGLFIALFSPQILPAVQW